MKFDKEDDGIILLLAVTSVITILLVFYQNHGGIGVKPLLQRRSTKSVYHKIMSELKLQGRLIPENIFV